MKKKRKAKVTMTGQDTSEKLENMRFDEIWRDLTRNQRRFVIACLDGKTKKDAALYVGLNPSSVYNFGDEVDEAIAYLQSDVAEGAVDMLSSALAKAVMVKIAGLDSQDERVSQASATEIMDRILGRATQHSVITGKDGGPIETKDVSLVRQKLLADIERRLASDDNVTAESVA